MGYTNLPHHNGKSRVKIIHNVANGPAVDVLLDGTVALGNVPYKKQSDYLMVTPGNHKLEIVANGKQLAFSKANLSPNTDYTVIAHGDVKDLSSIDLLVLEDNNSCPSKGKGHVRFVHAAATAPAVDIVVGDNTVIFSDVSYGSTGKPVYLPVDSGNVVLSVRVAGTKDTVVGPVNLEVADGEVITITATGLVGDSNSPLGALAMVDNKCRY
jgi:hypothetical protein